MREREEKPLVETPYNPLVRLGPVPVRGFGGLEFRVCGCNAKSPPGAPRSGTYLGFEGVQGLGFRVCGCKARSPPGAPQSGTCLGFEGVQGLGFRVWGCHARPPKLTMRLGHVTKIRKPHAPVYGRRHPLMDALARSAEPPLANVHSRNRAMPFHHPAKPPKPRAPNPMPITLYSPLVNVHRHGVELPEAVHALQK